MHATTTAREEFLEALDRGLMDAIRSAGDLRLVVGLLDCTDQLPGEYAEQDFGREASTYGEAAQFILDRWLTSFGLRPVRTGTAPEGAVAEDACREAFGEELELK